MNCPREDTLNAFLAGQLGAEAAMRTEGHVDTCPSCQELIAALGHAMPCAPGKLAVSDTRASREYDARGSSASGAASRGLLRPGAAVGRYIVLFEIGAGGMGVVYAAYDPELDRKVALKLLSTGIGGEGEGEARARLLGEAQAMARLAHPNVVSVYDVGVAEDRVFIVMEFVEGPTLRAWLLEQRRAWRDVLPIFLEAGRGLAAAHAAGIVHRDFKPGNVMVGRDGRVRVLDFGLARSGLLALATHSAATDAWTEASVIAGTPAYMAPEQHEGRRADARADQFGFCVALHEALHGVRPFVGETHAELLAAIRRGEIQAPRAGEIPGWLDKALRRGLSADPARRYRSLDDLLGILARDTRAARRKMAIAGVSLLSSVIVAGALRISSGPAIEPPCRGAERRLEGVWDQTTRAAARKAFLATGLPYAERTFERVATELDQRADTWATAHTDACEATAVRREQTEEQLGLRMVCLERRLDDLRALGELFSRADADVVDNASRAASELSRVSDCADLKALTLIDPLPGDAAARAEIAEVERALSRARVSLEAGRFTDGLTQVAPLVSRAAATGYRPLHAEALFTRARLEDRLEKLRDAEADYHATASVGIAGHRDDLVAKAWIDLLGILTFEPRRADEAARTLAYARAAVGRRGAGQDLAARLSVRLCERGNSLALAATLEKECRDAIARTEALAAKEPELFASALKGLAHSLRQQGKSAEARVSIERARALLEAELGAEHPSTLAVRRELTQIHRAGGDLTAAEAEARAVLALRERVLPKDHPNRLVALYDLADILAARGSYEAALPLFERVLEGDLRVHGEDSEQTSNALESLGTVLRHLGRADEALARHRRALAIREKVLGPEHVAVASSLSNLSILREAAGAREEAISLSERALAIREKVLGPEHPLVARALYNLGTLYAMLGQYDKAEPLLARALSANEARLGKDHPLVADPLMALGQIHMERKAPKRAAPLFERALSLRLREGQDPVDLADARFAVARALVAARDDRARARALAEQARKAYIEAGPRAAEELRDLEAWLAKTGR